MPSQSKRITICALLTTAGLILGYLESFIVLPVHIPGIRIGLANTVSLIALYITGPVSSAVVAVLRVTLSGLLFGSPISFAYSLAGALVSVTGMYVMKKLGFSIYSVSVTGALLHNTAQIVVARFFVGSGYVFVYIPVLWAAGIIAGLFVGFLSNILISRLTHIIYPKQGR